jgi:hypothetical protein
MEDAVQLQDLLAELLKAVLLVDANSENGTTVLSSRLLQLSQLLDEKESEVQRMCPRFHLALKPQRTLQLVLVMHSDCTHCSPHVCWSVSKLVMNEYSSDLLHDIGQHWKPICRGRSAVFCRQCKSEQRLPSEGLCAS